MGGAWIIGVGTVVVLLWALAAAPQQLTGVSASAATVPRSQCQVELLTTTTTATVTIDSGCSGSYMLSSYATQSDVYSQSKPQTLFARVTHAPYTVALPPCYWQVDFSEEPTTPGGAPQLVAGRLGGKACSTTTSTTTPSTTTTSTPTTATTVAPTTTTAPGPPVALVDPSTTSTTAPRTSPGGSGPPVPPTTAPTPTSQPTTSPSGSDGTTGDGTAAAAAGSTQLSATFDAAAPSGPTASGGHLAFTGFDAALLCAFGVALILAGLAVHQAGRTRRRAVHHLPVGALPPSALRSEPASSQRRRRR